MASYCDFFTLYKDGSFEFLGSKVWGADYDSYKEECKITDINEWNSKILEMIENSEDGIKRERGYKFHWEYTMVSDCTLVFREEKSKVFGMQYIDHERKLGVFIDPLDEDFRLSTPSLKPIQTYRSKKMISEFKFTVCPICDHWIDPGLNYKSCKYCEKNHGDILQNPNKDILIEKYNFDNPKNVDKEKERDYSFNFDKSYYYGCFWIKKFNGFIVFSKGITKEKYDHLDKLYNDRSRFD